MNVVGTQINDDLVGGSGDDILEGLRGDDDLSGGPGADTYVFDFRFGQDFIFEEVDDTGDMDTIRFAPGITPDMVTLYRGEAADAFDPPDLLLTFETNQITVVDQFQFPFEALPTAPRVELIEFAETGQTIDLTETAIDSFGRTASAILAGIDTPVDPFFSRDIVDGDTVTRQYGQGILPDGLIFFGEWGAEENLLIYKNTSGFGPGQFFDKINDQYLWDVPRGSDPKIDFISFLESDVVIDLSDVALTWYHPEFDSAQLVGLDGNDLLVGNTGDDRLFGYGGDDFLQGSRGDDTLEGGNGSDTYSFDFAFGTDRLREVADPENADVDTIVLGSYLDGTTTLTSVPFELSGLSIYRSPEDPRHLVLDFGALIQRTQVRDETVERFVETAIIILDQFASPDDVSTQDYLVERLVFEDAGTEYALSDFGLFWSGTDGDDLMYGGTTNDDFSGGQGADTIYAADGDDTLRGGADDDVLGGWSGSDTYFFGLAHGDDIIDREDESRTDIDTLSMDAGILPEDLIISRDDRIPGNMIIETGQGSITIFDQYASLEADENPWPVIERIVFASSTTVIDFTGPDWLETTVPEITGTTEDDTLLAVANQSSRFDGMIGRDTIDYSMMSSGIEVALLEQRALHSASHEDQLIRIENVVGTNYNDVLSGNGQNNDLTGGTGDDFIDGRAGSDRIDAGAGDDTVNGGIGAETVYGGDGDDVVSGGSGFDLIHGDDGDDQLSGNAGNDVIHGNAGNDVIEGGIGADRITGGDGSDEINGGSGSDQIFGDGGEDVLRGNAGNDALDGGTGDDLIFGGQGSDVVQGGSGDDTIRGETGFDDLFGGAGDDVVRGGDGNDRIDGGADNDVLVGGAGADVFVYNDGTDLIEDMSLIVDQLALDASALGLTGMTGHEILDAFATTASGDTIFTFGLEDVLTVSGVTNRDTLAGLIEVI